MYSNVTNELRDKVEIRVDHPPWYVHLFMADLYGSAILHMVDECPKYTQENKLMHLKSIYSKPLPNLLFNISDTEHSHCAPNKPVLVDKQAYEEYYKLSQSPSNQITEDTNTSNGRWMLRDDGNRHKPGWIIEGSSTPDNVDHELHFPFQFPLNFTFDPSGSVLLFLRVGYMRTYENAGIVSVKVCGQVLENGELDALWSDYQTYHASTVEDVGLAFRRSKIMPAVTSG